MSIIDVARSQADVRMLSVSERDRRQAPIVLAIFVIAQVLDAMLTYGGVSQLGIHVEMNMILATWMHLVGPGVTLVVAKVIACLCGLFLYSTARHRMLAVATGLSIGVGVVPWLVVFIL